MLRAFAEAMEGGPGFPWWIPWIALVALLVTVIHEGGHLLAALWTGQENVSLRIGSFGGLIEQRLGAVKLEVRAFAAPWRSSGAVSFDAQTTAQQMLGIALAGPAASLGGAAATAWLAASSSSSAVSEFFAAATIVGVLAGALNLIPMTLVEGTRRRPGARLATDGRHALNALQVLGDLRH